MSCSHQSLQEVYGELRKLVLKRGNRSKLAMQSIASIVRLYSLYLCKFTGTHLGSCMSLADILTTLYGKRLLNYEDRSLTDPTCSDPLILSVGHAAGALYSMFHLLGLVDEETFVNTRTNGGLPGHPERALSPKLTFLSSGSLGQGLGEALGAALALPKRKVFAIIGDGESQEGLIQEAIGFGGRREYENLIAIIDCNKIQLSGATSRHGWTAERLADLFKGFGWNVIKTNGHDFIALERSFRNARSHQGSPSVIIADTIMGKGVSIMEEATHKGDAAFHQGTGALTEEKFDHAHRELLTQLKQTLIALEPKWWDVFQDKALKPYDFVKHGPTLVQEANGPTTQDGFIKSVCDLISENIPVAFIAADLWRSGSTKASRVLQAITKKKTTMPSYQGFCCDPGIRELLGMSMLKGIARATEQQKSHGEIISQGIVPIFCCYAPMIHLPAEPIRVAAKDNLQFIINTPLFGMLETAGGNSHTISILGLSNILPVFVPATEFEAGHILRTSASRILDAKQGRCCIVTNRFKATPSTLDGELFVSGESIGEVDAAVAEAWKSSDPWSCGAYLIESSSIIGGHANATVITSGPLIYICWQAKKLLSGKGVVINIINVLRYGRQSASELAQSLGKLLPKCGVVLTTWDGDQNVLLERVYAAAFAANKCGLLISAHGPTEESSARGTIGENLQSLKLTPQEIAQKLLSLIAEK